MTMLTEESFRRIVQQHVKTAGGLCKAAKEIGVSTQYLSDFVRGNRGAGKKISAYFNLTPRLYFVQRSDRGD